MHVQLYIGDDSGVWGHAHVQHFVIVGQISDKRISQIAVVGDELSCRREPTYQSGRSICCKYSNMCRETLENIVNLFIVPETVWKHHRSVSVSHEVVAVFQ